MIGNVCFHIILYCLNCVKSVMYSMHYVFVSYIFVFLFEQDFVNVLSYNVRDKQPVCFPEEK